MESGAARQGTTPRRIHPGWVRCLAWMALLFSSVVGMASPYPTWAGVYQCRDKAGKTVLTDKPSKLHKCHALSGGTGSALMPPASRTKPQASAPPISNEGPPDPPYVPPMPPDQPADTQGASIDSLPAPNPGASASASPPQPCARGLNPFNPLTAPPCVRSDQSEANPPEEAPPPFQ